MYFCYIIVNFCDLVYYFSTTLRAHLFGQIDFFLMFCTSHASAATEGGSKSKKKLILLNKCGRNVVEKRPRDSHRRF